MIRCPAKIQEMPWSPVCLELDQWLISVFTAPKKKEQQKMSLGTFLQDESW
jgi:hypothetical protein